MYEALHWSIIFDNCIAFPIILIFLAVCKFMQNFLIPVSDAVLNNPTYQQLTQLSVDAAFAGTWSVCQIFGFQLAISLLQLEDRHLVAVLVQLPLLILAGVFCYLAQYFCGDNAPFYFIIGLCDVFNSVVGWGIVLFFYMKYRQLNKLNAAFKKDHDD